MDSLESALIGSCEEMMRLIRESPSSELALEHDHSRASQHDGNDDSEDDNDDDVSDNDDNNSGGHIRRHRGAQSASPSRDADAVATAFSAENFTSPFNIRVPLKQREPYFVPGINQEPPPKADDHGMRCCTYLVIDLSSTAL